MRVYTPGERLLGLGNPCRLSSLYGETPIDEDSCCWLRAKLSVPCLCLVLTNRVDEERRSECNPGEGYECLSSKPMTWITHQVALLG